MNNEYDAGVGCLILIILIPALSLVPYNIGSIDGRNGGILEGTNKTTLSCIEKPSQCQERYKYLKLREKLGE